MTWLDLFNAQIKRLNYYEDDGLQFWKWEAVCTSCRSGKGYISNSSIMDFLDVPLDAPMCTTIRTYHHMAFTLGVGETARWVIVPLSLKAR